jgi:predicted membrane-bound spermidine synthase
MWYHYAFMAVSLAMFGMTIGALVVYLRPNWFPVERIHQQLTRSGLAFPVLILFSLVVHLCIPFPRDPSVVGLLSIALNYTVIAVPFVASGTTITLVLTRFPAIVGKLYASDLVGASFGCVAMVLALQWMDGPSAVILSAAIAAIAPICFSRALGATRTGRTAVALAVALGALATLNAKVVRDNGPGLRPVWVKGKAEEPPAYERWNSFSRVAAWGPLHTGPAGWGFSSQLPKRLVDKYVINIDASASTDLTRFDGNAASVDYLRYDVTNLAHQIRHDASVLVIGVGGGRDILSALSFGQKRIVGVELNGRIVDALTDTYAAFGGHLERDPRVTIVADEARSYAARSGEKFDIIQASLIDTWAATAAGAFVLGESALYTTEGWRTLMARLTPRGVLTFSRWYRNDAAEVYRLTALATKALLDRGVSEPRRNVMLVRRMGDSPEGDGPEGIGTILVSPSAFSEEDVATIRRVSDDLGFEVMLSPDFARDATFASIAANRDLDRFADAYPFDISPPTDDRPFFFQMLRLRDVVHPHLESSGWRTNALAVLILATILATVVVLTVLCIVVPLWLTTSKGALRGASPLFAYFAAIGFGFMLVEMSMMQRLNLFLGHPVYGATVVLSSMLLCSGIGSYLSQVFIHAQAGGSAPVRCLAAVICVVLVWAIATPPIFSRFVSYGAPVRIAIATTTIAPVALFMGTAFPLGLRVASVRSSSLLPWLWGINGATSVCASVLAIGISLSFSISTALYAGACCYAISLLAFVRARTSVSDEKAVAAAAA